LRTLGAASDLVVQVKVVDQHTIYSDFHIRTKSTARVLHVFKTKPPAGAAVTGSVLTVTELGGSIDRGSTIDAETLNIARPLLVGDEYVLFLAHGSDADFWILDGAFLIRNGQEQSLGRGPAAEAWRSITAEAFLRALADSVVAR
jgi:hypothetical protein